MNNVSRSSRGIWLMVQVHLLLNQKSMLFLKNFFIFIFFIIYQALEPSLLFFITCIFAYRFILAKKYLLYIICCQIFTGFYSSVLKFFLIVIACLDFNKFFSILFYNFWLPRVCSVLYLCIRSYYLYYYIFRRYNLSVFFFVFFCTVFIKTDLS